MPSDSSPISKPESAILGVTVFICGAVVMIFEIVGSRILSPFIGTSTYIWTSLIGVILGSLSLGYWAGGRLADRRPHPGLLATIILTAGGLIALTVLIKDIVLSTLVQASMGLEFKAVLASLLLFAPASVCLGIVAPFAVRLRMRALDQTGATVGNLYALSTIGSIAGTFAAGFFLIPFVGSVRTLYIIAGLLVVVSVLLAPLAVSRLNIAVITLLVTAIGANEVISYTLRVQSDLYDIDTEYSRVQVFRTTDPTTGRRIRALATDPYFVQSAMFLDSDDLVLEYSKYYHLIRHFNPDFERTLIIGGAGYSFPREYLAAYPEARLDVAEIDPGMTQIAREFFRLADNPRMRIFHEDGRMFINRAPSKQYDVILMDAFGSLFSVPTHLTTVEAVEQMSRILKDDGVVVFNLGSAITGPASGFFQAEIATYRAVFPYVYVFKVRSDYADDKLQNLIIVASKLSGPAITESTEIDSMLTNMLRQDLPTTKAVLSDDLAPVEFYNSAAQNRYLSGK